MDPIENQTTEHVFRKHIGELELNGTCQEIALVFNRLTLHEKLQVRHLSVNLEGQTVSQGHKILKILTILASFICLLPVLLFFSEKFRKKVSDLYNIPTTTYVTMAQYIVECSNLEQIDITLRDNYISKSKTDIIDKALASLPFITSLNFRNNCKAFDLEGSQYSRFPQHFPKIKQITRLSTNIKWRRYQYESKGHTAPPTDILTKTRIVLPTVTQQLRINKI